MPYCIQRFNTLQYFKGYDSTGKAIWSEPEVLDYLVFPDKSEANQNNQHLQNDLLFPTEIVALVEKDEW